MERHGLYTGQSVKVASECKDYVRVAKIGKQTVHQASKITDDVLFIGTYDGLRVSIVRITLNPIP
jgi:hypothetical protein